MQDGPWVRVWTVKMANGLDGPVSGRRMWMPLFLAYGPFGTAGLKAERSTWIPETTWIPKTLCFHSGSAVRPYPGCCVLVWFLTFPGCFYSHDYKKEKKMNQ